MSRIMPRYPIFMPSKGRADYCLSAMQLCKDGVPFTLVVEPDEYTDYAREWADKPEVQRILVLPFEDRGLHATRSWIKDFVMANTDSERHWQIDDNIRHWGWRYKAKRMRVDAGIILRLMEDYTDRYTNVAISGPNYYMFVPDHTKYPFLSVNAHVYSCSLIRSDEFRWRIPLNDDTDYCLQVLTSGHCTILFHALLQQKLRTMLAKGGNTADHYKKRDGRLRMAESLRAKWPGIVTVERRFQRPQHVIKGQWKLFDTPLIPKSKDEWPKVDYLDKIQLVQLDQIKSSYVQSLKDTWEAEHGI